MNVKLYLVSRLRISGATPPLPLYAFKACTGTFLYVVNNHNKFKRSTCVYVYSLQTITAVPNTHSLSSNTNGLRGGVESSRNSCGWV